MVTKQESLNIDDQLRLILFGLECALNVEFDPAQVEQVFVDEMADASLPIHYVFYDRTGLRVIGQVEDYEPGTLWLNVESRKDFQPSLAVIAERAKFQVYRLENSRDRSQG